MRLVTLAIQRLLAMISMNAHWELIHVTLMQIAQIIVVLIHVSVNLDILVMENHARKELTLSLTARFTM